MRADWACAEWGDEARRVLRVGGEADAQFGDVTEHLHEHEHKRAECGREGEDSEEAIPRGDGREAGCGSGNVRLGGLERQGEEEEDPAGHVCEVEDVGAIDGRDVGAVERFDLIVEGFARGCGLLDLAHESSEGPE